MTLGTTRHLASTILVAGTLCACVLVLSGCIPLVIGGVAATAAVATDRRTTGAQLDDELIEDKTTAELLERYKGREVHLNVTSFNGIVLLTGEAPTEDVKLEIENVARRMPKVRSVQNEMVVGPATDLGSRSNDTFITSKVKARFVDEGKFNAVHVKVVTEASVVYLLGLVKRKEADDAVEITRTTSGVQKVVKLFEYID